LNIVFHLANSRFRQMMNAAALFFGCHS
jgi:hypothetical protein